MIPCVIQDNKAVQPSCYKSGTIVPPLTNIAYSASYNILSCHYPTTGSLSLVW